MTLRKICLALVAALAVPAAFAPALAQARDMPPDRPKVEYSITFDFERREAGYVEKGSRRITVAGVLVRDEPLTGDDHTVFIADRAAGTVLEFDPADPTHKARRTQLGSPVVPMADGYGDLLARQGQPRVAGTAKVAGFACTRLVWQGEGADVQEWCVTAAGIVVRALRQAGLSAMRLEATKLVIGRPNPALMRPPPGFTIFDAVD